MAVPESETLERPGIVQVADLARQLRADSIRCSTPVASGHPTSSLSAADLMAVLLARHLRYDWAHPKAAANDRLVFSKGHASPLLYSMFKAAGVITDAELIDTYRRFGSRLQGHPTPVLPWVEVATGSLGQGLPDAVGMALAGQKLDKLDYHVWVLCGDSEMAEGSIWEALDKASFYRLANLTVIVDVNRLGQTGPTEYQWDLNVYKRRAEAFGCLALEVNGHDPAAIDQTYEMALRAERPVVILARTIKGKGVPEVEDKNGWHGKPIPPDIADKAVAALGGARELHAGLPPRDPYQPGGLLSLGKPGLIDDLFREAVFSRVATTKVLAQFRLPSAKDYLDFIRTSASPILQMLGRLDDAARDAAWAEIEDKLSAFNTPSGWEGPNELLLTVGRR